MRGSCNKNIQTISNKYRVKIDNFFFSFTLTAQRKSYLQYVHRDLFLYILLFFHHVDAIYFKQQQKKDLIYYTEILLQKIM